jgi:hypothetical protein
MGNADRTNGLVPEGARLAAVGKPGIAHFSPGGVTIYVVDETAKSLVFSGAIPDDAQVVVRVDPDAEAIVAAGPSSDDDEEPMILAKPIDKTHRFSIWTTGQYPAAAAPTTRSIEISE